MTEEQQQQLQLEREESEHMVALFVALLQELGPHRVFAAFEWPAVASAWKKPFKALQTLVQLLPLQLEFDGCMYGWNTQKPWRVQTNCPALRDALNRRCNHAGAHQACRGKLARESELYTDELAEAVASSVCHSGVSLVAPLDAAAEDELDDAVGPAPQSGRPLE